MALPVLAFLNLNLEASLFATKMRSLTFSQEFLTPGDGYCRKSCAVKYFIGFSYITEPGSRRKL
jgi:hypothetical protein